MSVPRPTIDVNAVLLQEKRQKRARRVNKLCWFYVVLLLIYWTVLIWYGDTWWPGTLLLYGPRWPMALPLVILAPLAWEWGRKALIPCTLAFLILAFPITGINIPYSSWMTSVPADTGKLRIVTFNADMGKIKMAAWNEFLKQTKPDIVVCQEWPVGSARPEEWQQGWHIQEHLGNLLVASRWPIAKTELLRENELQIRGYVGWYDLNTPFGPISLADVHLPTPRGEGELEEALHGKWHKFADLDLLSERRLYASRYVREWLSKFPGPMMVVGDFNLPSDSNIYAGSWNRYQDAFAQAGWGWGYTKWTRWYGMRIDHILFEKGWAATRCWVGKDVGSDHLPLVADIVFTGGN
ncbi:MAG: endonuclease/exonuclease/phosphatase family protein [Gemmatales bacterium]